MSVKVIDKGWKKVQGAIRDMTGATVKVGYPQSKARAHGDKSPIDIATLAGIHEYGTATIPARPFQAQAFDKNLSKINAMVKKEVSAVIDGDRTIRQSLQNIGVFHKGNIQAIFDGGSFAPNKPATVKAKGSSKPLIDTGQLRQSVDFEVVEGRK